MTDRSLKALIANVIDARPEDLSDDSGVNVTENWTSLSQFIIMSAIESDFNAKLSFDEIEHLATIRDIRAALLAVGVAVND